jgi:Ca2+-binding RTX toxin-like protein
MDKLILGNLMTLRKSIALFIMAMFAVVGALLGATASHIVIPSAFPHTSSLAQVISYSAQQEETGQSSSSFSAADDDSQTNTNTESLHLDFDQDIESEVEQEAEQAADNLVLPDQDDAQEDITCEGETATIVGTPGDDELVGTEDRDVIAALEGDDEIQGLGGDDLLCGDEGNDTMFGGDGDDIMEGDEGDDNMFGGDNADRLNSIDGVVNNDSLDGGDLASDRCLSDPDPEVNCELD